MKKVVEFIRELIIAVIVLAVFLCTLCLAWLQTSYRYSPPTEAERAEHPVLIKFLVGE